VLKVTGQDITRPGCSTAYKRGAVLRQLVGRRDQRGARAASTGLCTVTRSSRAGLSPARRILLLRAAAATRW